MRPEDADRLARLHKQTLVVAQRLQSAHDCIEGLPRARGPAGAPINHQVVGILCYIGVEVVHEHPHGGLLLPASAGELGSAGGADGPGRSAHRSLPTATSTA